MNSRRFSRFAFAAVALCSCLIGNGCQRAGSPKSKGVIGVAVLTLSNPFFKVIGDTITAEAAKHGYDVVVVSSDNDVVKQENQIHDFLVQHVAAIVLNPCDSRSIGPAIVDANRAGVPVFTCDIKCLAPEAKVVCHVATDNYAGGKMAGDALIEALGPAGGKTLIVDHKLAESCIMRVKGFREVVEAHNKTAKGGTIQIVADLPGGGEKERGYKCAEDTLQAHPDLAAIFAINDPSALGAVAAVEKAGKTGRVKIIGFDGQIDGRQAIKEGKIYADPIQFPDKIGAKTVAMIVAYFDGESVPAQVLIPTALYRQTDGQKDPSLK